MAAANCRNCGALKAANEKPHCRGCERALSTAPKLTDALNNRLERSGGKFRFKQSTVEHALLEQRREEAKKP